MHHGFVKLFLVPIPSGEDFGGSLNVSIGGRCETEMGSNSMGNTFGHLFRITTWGESHGGAIGVVIDGCPPKLKIDIGAIQAELDRRRPGQSHLTTSRQEEDRVEILSGVFEGQTLGSPISMLVWNKDAKPAAYEHLKDVYRPSHADFTYQQKFGLRNWQGGGRASARETIGRVAAGAIAKQILREQCETETLAYVKQIHTIQADVDSDTVTLDDIESSLVRCPDPKASQQMAEQIDQARRDGDSLGGIIESVSRNVPVGLGEPVFDKLKADLAKAMMSLPATMGFQIGSGFGSVVGTGSQHQRPLLQRPRACPYADEQFRGDAGRHIERRKHHFSGRFQADSYHSQGAGNSEHPRGGRHAISAWTT